jgi:hypothetical protein
VRIKVQVNSEELQSFLSKKTGSKIDSHRLFVQDRTDEGARLKLPFEYGMSEEEAKAHSGKLKDKFIMLDVDGLAPGFGGVLRATGSIVKVL